MIAGKRKRVRTRKNLEVELKEVESLLLLIKDVTAAIEVDLQVMKAKGGQLEPQCRFI